MSPCCVINALIGLNQLARMEPIAFKCKKKYGSIKWSIHHLGKVLPPNIVFTSDGAQGRCMSGRTQIKALKTLLQMEAV